MEIIYEPDFSIPNTLVGDPVRIAQILNNLISNAIKFTDKGFIKIILELVNKESDHVNIRFTVKDSGIGVAPSKVDSIFDAFTQASSDTTRKYGGTGLGLAIVKSLPSYLVQKFTWNPSWVKVLPSGLIYGLRYNRSPCESLRPRKW